MSAPAPALWVGREAGAAGPWLERVRAAGWEARALPLIRTEPLDPSPAEAAWIEALEEHAAVLFASARAVRRLRRLARREPWPKGLDAGAVGPATAAALVEWMAAPRWIAPGGTGEDLARRVLAEAGPGPLLWAGAEGGRPEGPDLLRAAGRELRRLALYHTQPLEDGPVPAPGEPVLLFSPSGARALARRLGGRPAPVWALGPSTAAEARSLGLAVEGVLAERRPEALDPLLHAARP